MRNTAQTIGHLIDKQSVAFISLVDGDGVPNTKGMLAPRKRDGIRTFYFTPNTSLMRVAQTGRYYTNFGSEDFVIQ